MQGPAGEVLSNAVNCTGFTVMYLTMPDDWSGRQPITFQFSGDGTDWFDLFRPEGPQLVPYEVACHVMLNAIVSPPTAADDIFAFVRLRSGLRGGPVPQAADRTFGLVVVPRDNPVVLARIARDCTRARAA